MKLSIKIAMLVLALTFCVAPIVDSAEKAGSYFAVKAGIYSPESSDLTSNGADFDNGFNGEIAFGRYLSQNFAAELGLGYFKTTDDQFGIDADIRAIPLTLSGKFLLPMGNFEPYAEIGIGIYATKLEVSGFGVSADDDDTTFGWHLGLGANYNITTNIFLGVEGRYLWASPEFSIFGVSDNVNINGITITANLGYRF